MKSILSILTLSACYIIIGWSSSTKACKNSSYIIEQAKRTYDAKNTWQTSTLEAHIQEPRVGLPHRYSELRLNNDGSYFDLKRENKIGTVIHRTLNSNGDHHITLNGMRNLTEQQIEKYVLTKEKTAQSKEFYELLYGMPMSLTKERWKQISAAKSVIFKGKKAYEINLEMQKKWVSSYWQLYIDREHHRILAIKFNESTTENSPGELLYFEDDLFEINGYQIPRIRHWYSKDPEEGYLGSDIIVDQLTN